MFQPLLFKAALVARGYSVIKLAEAMEMSKVALYNKIKTGRFLRGEIAKIVSVLGLSDAEMVNIFFCRYAEQ